MAASEAPFHHYTLSARGRVVEPDAELGTAPGPALLSAKVWAPGHEAAGDMLIALANRFGVKLAGTVDLHESEPSRPAEDRPYAYDVQVTPEDTAA